jgi:hypothetical protein
MEPAMQDAQAVRDCSLRPWPARHCWRVVHVVLHAPHNSTVPPPPNVPFPLTPPAVEFPSISPHSISHEPPSTTDELLRFPYALRPSQ